jgi:hypothetical protein
MPLATDKAWLKERNKYPSGYCNEHGKIGCHEGTKPRDSKGNPLKTCPLWDTCPCKCHYDLDELFRMVGKERLDEVPNPEYHAPVSPYVMPTPEMVRADNAAFRADAALITPNPEWNPNTSPAPVTAPLASRRTATGRAARGGLEAQVFEACQTWMDDETEIGSNEYCTPKIVAEWIVFQYKIPTPSSGAIAAVWDRWVKLGIAIIEKKPLRLTEIKDMTWDDLENMKRRNRTVKKSAATRIDQQLGKRK